MIGRKRSKQSRKSGCMSFALSTWYLFGADGEPAPGLVAEPEKEDGLFPEVGDPANEDDPEDETADM